MKCENEFYCNDSINMYMKEINNYPLISFDEEKRLGKLISEGHEDEKQKLILSNLRLVVYIAKKYSNCGLPLIDLIQEGNIGLIKAVDRYDYKKEIKFSTFATFWIKQAILRAINNDSRIIHLPVNISERVIAYKKTFDSLVQNLGYYPSEEELSQIMNISINEIRENNSYLNEITSLDAPIGEEEDGILSDLIEDINFKNPESDYIKQAWHDELINVINTLPKQESEVIIMRFGLNGNQAKSLEEIGKIYGVTKQRIRQLEISALKKLRQPSRARKLKEAGAW